MSSETQTLTFTCNLHLQARERGRLEMKPGAKKTSNLLAGRVPRISRLMALAIRFEGLIQRGEVTDYAELARLGHVSRARLTQIMNLLNLAPDIQEALLFLPLVTEGRERVKEWMVRPVTAEVEWGKQRVRWRKICG